VQFKLKANKKKCLLVGDANFVLKNLSEALIFQNCEVFLISSPKFNLSDSDKLTANQNFSILDLDVAADLPTNLPRFDYIFQLVGFDKNSQDKNQSLQFLLANSIGTKNLLEKALSDKAKFLLFSFIKTQTSSDDFGNYFKDEALDSHSFEDLTCNQFIRFAETLVSQYFQAKKLDARIVRTTQVYGPGMDLEGEETVGKIVKQAVGGQSITIFGDSLGLICPTFISDLIYGLTKAMFQEDTRGKIYNLVNPQSITLLAFAQLLERIIQEQNGQIMQIIHDEKSEFVQEKVQLIDFTTSQKSLGWEPKVSLEHGLKETFNFFSQAKKLPPTTIISPEAELPKKAKKFLSISWAKNFLVMPTRISLTGKKKAFLGISTLILIFVFLVFGLFFGSGFLAYHSFLESQQSFNQKKFTQAASQSQRAANFFKIASATADFLAWPFNKFGIKNGFATSKTLFDVGQHSSLALFYLAEDGGVWQSSAQKILKKEADLLKLKQEIEKVQGQINASFGQVVVADLYMDSLSGKYPFFGVFNKKISQAKNQIQLAKNYLGAAHQMTKALPDLLGFEGQKRYLVLLQNNHELRPTGGFIGSYAEIVFEKGNLLEFKVDDIYNIDGQLKVNFDPPKPIQANLGQKRWFLRDSNWFADFGQNAKIAQDFYLLETGKKVDGVIGVDVDFVASLVDSLGKVEVAGVKEPITKENLFDQAEFHSEIDFQPGSTAKRDFLTLLTSQIMAKLIDFGPEIDITKLVKSFGQATEEKHLLFYFDDPKLEMLAAKNNFGGTLVEIPFQKDKASLDYLSVVEANVGANKANRFVSRQIFYNPIIKRDGDLSSHLKIIYQNQSPAETWPGGIYKNYLRVFAPKGSILEKFDDGQNSVLGKVETETFVDKQSFGIQIEVGVGQTKEVSLEYLPPVVLNFENNQAQYNLVIQKQPGTDKDLLAVNLNYPSYMTPTSSVPQGVVSEQTLTYKTNLTSDKSFNVGFFKENKVVDTQLPTLYNLSSF